MSKQMNIRLDEVHMSLLEKMVEKMKEEGINTNKTDTIQKAIYSFARNNVLGQEVVSEIIDKYYRGERVE
ncbi:hypothetical protein J2S74_005423 [Evansella vedderi]|uniref:Uncharacterized protein n=1 Tax=Evansella vedderi TaxID=38282 RepID=A0ABU0A3X7_9BACI|nr:hypothetical protein [Evansella vedderi]MDQ0257960.1 hypothetical protein [Evansella vedderi]